MPEPEIDFSCHVCGKQCDIAPNPPEKAVCDECCADHEYEYDRDEFWHCCKTCGKRVDVDWYYCDDDVI